MNRGILTALLLALPGIGVAQQRFWTYGPGCSVQDFASPCWAAFPGGPGLQSVPGPADDVFLLPTAAAEVPVIFANPGATQDRVLRSLTLDGRGAAARLDIARRQLTSPDITLGVGGSGRLLHSGGALVNVGSFPLGRDAGRSGEYRVSGGTALSGRAFIGSQGGQGTAVLSGTAQWTVGDMTVGGNGHGLLELQAGAALNVADTVTVAGSVAAGSTGRIVQTGGTARSGDLVVLSAPFGGASVLLSGSGTSWSTRGLAVGGRLDVAAGARLETTAAAGIGNTTSPMTGITLSGAGSQWKAAGPVVVARTLDVLDGASFDGQAVTVGGFLAQLQVAGPGSTFRGSLLEIGPDMFSSGRAVIGEGGEVSVGMLRLGGPGSVVLTGGRLRVTAVDTGLVVGNLGIDGAPSSRLEIERGGSVTGYGPVGAPIRGRDITFAAPLLVPPMGWPFPMPGIGVPLAVGRYDTPGALDLTGTTRLVALGSAGAIEIRDGAAARLGEQVLIEGRLTVRGRHGLRLEPGDLLRVVGGSGQLEMPLFNEGLVDGGAGLVLSGPVAGGGDYAGRVHFSGRFAPADEVSFNDGAASFAASSELVLALDGPEPGQGYTRLLDIGTLHIDGRLRLNFGFEPETGSRFDLFDFGLWVGGGLDGSRIDVAGFDRTRLDFSRLAVDGSVLITAVPEPHTVALFIAGLALVAGRRLGPGARPAGPLRPT